MAGAAENVLRPTQQLSNVTPVSDRSSSLVNGPHMERTHRLSRHKHTSFWSFAALRLRKENSLAMSGDLMGEMFLDELDGQDSLTAHSRCLGEEWMVKECRIREGIVVYQVWRTEGVEKRKVNK